nr:hypothetical protein [bacterium]
QWAGTPELPVAWNAGDYETPVITFEKITRSAGDYALRVSHPLHDRNIYAVTTEPFNAVDVLPTKIKFELATDQTSKMSININCPDGETKVQVFYIFDSATKTFKSNDMNQYNVIDFGDTDFHQTEIIIGPEVTTAMWNSAKKCILEFKSGKNANFNIKIDNVIVE